MTSPVDELVRISPLEQERFGVRTARASEVTAPDLPAVLEFCRSESVEMLIARCSASDLAAAQAIEEAGGRIMDTLVYYAHDLREQPTKPRPDLVLRFSTPADAETVADMAAQSFQGYAGHYHADPRLDQAACDAAYASWSRRSVQSEEVAKAVLICELEGKISGFATLRMNSADEGEGVLFGVAPWAQGKGMYRAFIERSLQWCRDEGAARMVVSTQVTNLAVQKVWSRLGFEPSISYYTFHKWFS